MDVYGFCDNKCKHEIYTKDESDAKFGLKGDFAVVTGTMEATDTSTIIGQAPYPTGYNKDNCIIVGYSLKRSDADNWMMGSNFDSGNTFGSIPLKIQLIGGGLSISGKNITIINGDSPDIYEITNNIDYKIVLMKIS